MARSLKGVVTSPTVNGNTVVVDASSVFSLAEPAQLLLVYCEHATGAGVTNGDAILAIGAATRHSGSIQQGYVSIFDDDAAATGAGARGLDTTAILKTYNAATPTLEMEVDVTAFDEDGFTLTFTDAPGAAIKIHYALIGGSDVDEALLFQFNLAATVATQDVSTPGFQPDLLLVLHRGASSTIGDAAGNIGLGIGAGISDTESRQSTFVQQTGNTNMNGGAVQGDGILCCVGTPGGTVTIQAEADLSPRAQWPADGFELTYSTQAVAAYNMLGIALKGSFTAKVDKATAPTSGGLPVNVDLAHDNAPVAALFWGWSLPATAGLRTADADQNFMFIGASDGTNEGVAGAGTDEGVGTATTGRAHSESKSVQFYVQGAAAPVLQSEADGSISGNNFRLAYNDIDTVAREHNYLLLGSASGQSLALGQASESDTAQALARLKRRALGQATQVDAAQQLGRSKTLAIGPATESHSAQPIGHTRARALTPATELAAAQALGRAKTQPVGHAAEAEAAQAIGRSHQRALTPATAAESAQPVGRAKTRPLTPAAALEAAEALGRRKARTVGTASESDEAVAISSGGSLPIGPAVESNAAGDIGRRKARAVETAAEVDAAQALPGRHSLTIGPASESHAAQPLGARKSRTLDPATASEQAQEFGRRKVRLVGWASETDEAVAITSPSMQPEPAWLVLSDQPQASLTLTDEASVTLILSDQPEAHLALQDGPA